MKVGPQAKVFRLRLRVHEAGKLGFLCQRSVLNPYPSIKEVVERNKDLDRRRVFWDEIVGLVSM